MQTDSPYPLCAGQAVRAAHDTRAFRYCFDHDIIDGAPAARFTQRFKELIESGYELVDLMAEGERSALEGKLS